MRLLVTGSNGLMGNAIKHISKDYPNYECILANRNNYGDLTSEQKCYRV